MALPDRGPSLTSQSLLERLKSAESDDPQWRRLHDIYEPWIHRWLARFPDLRGDALDLTQDVFVVLIKELPTFNRQRDGSFRRWLSNVLLNRVRTHWKKRKRMPKVGFDHESGSGLLEGLEDPASDLSREWDREHDKFVLEQLMTTVRGEFTSSTWDAFRRCTVRGELAAVVAADLNLSVNAVLIAKFRVLQRLREEAKELID